MPLPKENAVWPLPGWALAFDRYNLNDALLLNDAERLRIIYTGGDHSRQGLDRTDAMYHAGILRRGGIINFARRWAWGKPVTFDNKRADLPVPIAATLAQLSANQLMAEPPMHRVIAQEDGTELNAAGKPVIRKGGVLKGDAQDRLDLLFNSDDAHNTLLEAAELAASISGAVLKWQWDKTDPDTEHIWFDAVGADLTMPEFVGGKLNAVLLFAEYPADHGHIFRHFEYHERGKITHALYQGTTVTVGRIVPFQKLEQVANLLNIPEFAVDADNIGELPTGTQRLTATYWKNLPTRAWRKYGHLAQLGRSDFEGIEPLIDQYQDTWASLARDIRLGKARLVVPESMLEGIGGGHGGLFDSDREIYAGLRFLSDNADAKTITASQPAIRYTELIGSITSIRAELLDSAGWSVSSTGNTGSGSGGGGPQTATEVVDRTSQSERTRDQKALNYKQAVVPFLRAGMEIDGLVYRGQGGGLFPEFSIDFPDVSQVDPEAQARTFMDLGGVHAISIYQMVSERHPNWDDDEKDEEVTRILSDLRAVAPAIMDPATFGVDGSTVNLNDPADPGDGGVPDGDEPPTPGTVKTTQPADPNAGN